jgi:hypothetical protein
MYAVPGSKCDASMRRTRPHFGIFTFAVRSSHFVPASREIQTLPSLVPTHTTPFCVRDGAIAEITAP